MPPTTLTQDYWPQWNTNLTTGCSSTNTWIAWQPTTTIQVWTDWNVQYLMTTASTTVQTPIPWAAWNGQDFIQPLPAPRPLFTPAVLPTPETAEHQAERQRQAEIRARQARRDALRREKERLASIRRARTLLRSILSRKEWDQWRKEAKVDIVAQSGRRYRLHRGSHGNVARLNDQNQEIENLCIGPRDGGGIPDEDVVASQVLMLQTDENRFRHIANIRNLQWYRDQQDRYRVEEAA